MKKIVGGQELKEKMKEAVNLLCNAAKITLGPTGKNVLINNSECLPFITNDGVTIAKFIESEDKIINTILEIAKEASLKTNEKVGDGTTTTLVLMQAIFNLGIEEIEQGVNPITLKNELFESRNILIKLLNKKSWLPNKNELKNIASISANDVEIGTLISEIYDKVKYRHSIKIEESMNEETYYKIKKGYSIEVGNISDIYFEHQKELTFSNAYILILDDYLDSLEELANILNEVIMKNKTLIILSEDFNEIVQNEILVYYLQKKANIFLIPLPDFASRKKVISQDLCLLTRAQKTNLSLSQPSWEVLGTCEQVTINKEYLTILSEHDMQERIHDIKEEIKICQEEYEKEFLEERLAMLETGIAVISVGGSTKIEKREKLMRFEDSIWAIEIAKQGILPGEGISLLEISDKLEAENTALKILKEALKQPFLQILQNVGIESNLLKTIKDHNFEKIYNIEKGLLENINQTKTLDPLLVVTESIINAISIAGMLLTTEYLVINDTYEKEQITI